MTNAPNDWKNNRLVDAILVFAGTATFFVTAVMPISEKSKDNKIEELTGVSTKVAERAADAEFKLKNKEEELLASKEEIKAAQAATKLAIQKAPFAPNSIYPFELGNIVLGTSSDEVLKRLPGSTWDEDKKYISYNLKDGIVFSGSAYYFDAGNKVSSILYHFSDPIVGAEIMRKALITNFGEPVAENKSSLLWKIKDHEWVSLVFNKVFKRFSYQIYLSAPGENWSK